MKEKVQICLKLSFSVLFYVWCCCANVDKAEAEAGFPLPREVTISLSFLAFVVFSAFMLGASVSLAVLQFTVRIPSTADITAVGLTVWLDSACTVPVSSIDWGVLAPGESKSLVLFLLSESNVPVTLSMNASSWNPPVAADYIQLSWNYNGVELQPQTVAPAAFTLTVSPSVSGFSSFNFEIVLVASG